MSKDEIKKRIEESLKEGRTVEETRRALEREGYETSKINRLISKVDKSKVQQVDQKVGAEPRENERGEQNISESDRNGPQNDTQEEKRDAGVSIIGGIKAGIKAGILVGFVFGLLFGGIITLIGSQLGGPMGAMLGGLGLVAILVGGIVWGIGYSAAGIIFGALFGGLSNLIPGKTSETKGMVFGAVLGIITTGGTISQSGFSQSILIIGALGLLFNIFWGYLLGRFSRPGNF